MRCWTALLAVVLSVFAFAVAPVLAATDRPVILVFGDSLSAGYGIDVRNGWVALLDHKLTSEGYEYKVVNASISGDTTAGGRNRLSRALELHHPQIVVLELGANDGLRGLPVEQMRANLAAMIALSQSAQARVLLVGMQMPPNYGADYAGSFKAAFEQLHSQTGVALAPFLLDGVALDMSLVQSDGLHPTAAAQPRLLNNVWPTLQPLLRKAKAAT
jgi:acyl-CoA thioesterase-1